MSKEIIEQKDKEKSPGILDGKHALVTGGAKGIGRAIVRDFVSEGARVSFFDIDEEAIKLLEDEFGTDVIKGYKVDITRKEELEKVFKLPGLDEIDIMLNNAGGGSNYSFDNPNDETWNHVMNANLNGARHVTEYVIPKMIKNLKGSIIFVSSVHTAQAFSQEAAYDASKHALIGMMRVLALDYGSKGIRVNAVAPGSIYHAGRTGLMTENEAIEFGKKVPLQRLGEPEDIAHVVTFISSDKAAYVHGTEIRVDGGMSIKNSLI